MNLKKITLFLILIPLLYNLSLLPRAKVLNVRYHNHPFFTRVVVDIEALREYYHGKLYNPDRIYIDFCQTKLDSSLKNKTFEINNVYLKRIRIAQHSYNLVRLVLDLDFSKIRDYRIFHLLDPFRIVIDIYPKERESEQKRKAINYKPPKPSTRGRYSLVRQLGLGVKTIVLDPGHGGKDPGAISKDKLIVEKEIVLDIARRVKKVLEENTDLEVILTRKDDSFLPLEDRAVIANQKMADLFISIHANSSPNLNAKGIETYYLNFTQDPHAVEVAARENATSTKKIGEMEEIIKKIIQNSKIEESRELAFNIQKNIIKSLSPIYPNIKDLGVKGGPFWVLIGADMPAVLIETSFLSNPYENVKLKSDEYRQRIAEGICDGIIDYINSLGKNVKLNNEVSR
ncbi:N-acetylmuramoyl-L-alanine amidase [SCandidatus Aminicenantes bacterium Aminicenantia_JdfR_composite]|jgi:N-acetylmuramoyl-L-alanine amidase|nr:N-acetylmuramoyl-L-alanine amidase [SCandidatus Aminicenantes bacterium Aminicenantia_JdfR_composite]